MFCQILSIEFLITLGCPANSWFSHLLSKPAFLRTNKSSNDVNCIDDKRKLGLYLKLNTLSIDSTMTIDLTDYSLFTQWPRFRVKHLLEFVGSGAKLQLCY